MNIQNNTFLITGGASGLGLATANLVKQIIENPMLNGEVIRLDVAIRMGAK